VDGLDRLRQWRKNMQVNGLSPRTIEEYTWYVVRFELDVGPWLEATYDGMLQHVFGRGKGARACRSAFVSLDGWCVRTGLLPVSRAVDLPSFPAMKKVPQAFSPEDLELVFNTAGAWAPWREGCLRFLYATGARIAEACAVEWQDVSERGVLLRFTKGNRGERFIPYSRTLGEALTLLPQGERVLPIGPSGVLGMCRRVGEQTGMHVHPHKFRATFATHMLERGVDIMTVSKLLGHQDIATTARYLAVSDERYRAAVAVLG
jgi:integrase/recombinase XerC